MGCKQHSAASLTYVVRSAVRGIYEASYQSLAKTRSTNCTLHQVQNVFCGAPKVVRTLCVAHKVCCTFYVVQKAFMLQCAAQQVQNTFYVVQRVQSVECSTQHICCTRCATQRVFRIISVGVILALSATVGFPTTHLNSAGIT